jgi:hypothetical protein
LAGHAEEIPKRAWEKFASRIAVERFRRRLAHRVFPDAIFAVASFARASMNDC